MCYRDLHGLWVCLMILFAFLQRLLEDIVRFMFGAANLLGQQHLLLLGMVFPQAFWGELNSGHWLTREV